MLLCGPHLLPPHPLIGLSWKCRFGSRLEAIPPSFDLYIHDDAVQVVLRLAPSGKTTATASSASSAINTETASLARSVRQPETQAIVNSVHALATTATANASSAVNVIVTTTAVEPRGGSDAEDEGGMSDPATDPDYFSASAGEGDPRDPRDPRDPGPLAAHSAPSSPIGARARTADASPPASMIGASAGEAERAADRMAVQLVADEAATLLAREQKRKRKKSKSKKKLSEWLAGTTGTPTAAVDASTLDASTLDAMVQTLHARIKQLEADWSSELIEVKKCEQAAIDKVGRVLFNVLSRSPCY